MPTGVAGELTDSRPEQELAWENRTSMIHRITVRSTLLAALVMTASVLAGCSSSDSTPSAEAPVESTTTAATPSTRGVPVTNAPRQACDANTLGSAATAALPGVTLTQLVCEPAFAIATWTAGPDGETAVLFALQDGVWAYIGSGPAGGDVAILAPSGFSATAVPAWQRLRTAIATRGGSDTEGGGTSDGGRGGGATTTSTVYFTDPDTGQLQSCTTNRDGMLCVPAPSIPPTSADPENPDDTVVPSGFCRFNFNDPRCQADNQYEP